MKKLYFLAMAATAVAMAVSAPEIKAQQGTIPVEGKSFSSSNWYISALGGEQALLKGSATGKYFVGKLNAGTWFDTWSGLKINVQGGLKKTNGNNSARYYSAGVDYTLNLLRVFGGYDEKTPFSFSLSAGPAYNLIRYAHDGHDYTHAVSLNVGAQAGYDFSPRWGIFAEAMSYTMENFASPGRNVLFGIDCAVGIRFRFSRHKYGHRDDDRRYYESRINALDARIAELEHAAEEKTATETAEKVIVAPETEAASVDIYFDEFSSFISDEQRKKIDGIGTWMTDNPDFNVRIIVFSDNLSDPETGKRIMESRADVLEDLLVEKYGIDSDRIESVGSEEVGYRNLTGCNAKIIFLK